LIKEGARRHLVKRQRSGLVRADDGRASQRFNTGQALDNGLVARHVAHAQRQCHRHHHRQTFGHGGDGQRNRVQRNMRQAVAAPERQAGQQGYQRQGNRAQALAQLVELELQWRGHFSRCRKLLRQLSHLGLRTCCRDDDLGPAAREQGVHVEHVGALGQGNVRRLQRVKLLADRQRLARQGGLVNFQPRRKKQSAVSRNRVARLQQNHIPRHQIFSRDFNFFAFPAHACPHRQHALEGRQTLFSAVFLVKADGGIDQDDSHNDKCILGVADQRGKRRRTDQNHDQNTFELREKH